MKNIRIENIDIDKLNGIKFNACFYACGYEERCIYQFDKYHFESDVNYVFCFDSNQNGNYLNNLELFKSGNNNIVYTDGEEDSDIISVLFSLIKEIINNQEINFYIDFSSMTKIWIASFLSFFKNLEAEKKYTINLFYSYSHSLFSIPELDTRHGIKVNPMNGFCNISIPDKPTALIIGLGYDKNMAIGLSQYLDAESYIFHTDDSYAADYKSSVLRENAELIEEIKEENIFEYPILDVEYTQTILHNLLLDLLQSNRIVLAPCGPKIFTLLCLIESLRLENVDVWRISSSSMITDKVITKYVDGKISVIKVVFE